MQNLQFEQMLLGLKIIKTRVENTQDIKTEQIIRDLIKKHNYIVDEITGKTLEIDDLVVQSQTGEIFFKVDRQLYKAHVQLFYIEELISNIDFDFGDLYYLITIPFLNLYNELENLRGDDKKIKSKLIELKLKHGGNLSWKNTQTKHQLKIKKEKEN